MPMEPQITEYNIKKISDKYLQKPTITSRICAKVPQDDPRITGYKLISSSKTIKKNRKSKKESKTTTIKNDSSEKGKITVTTTSTKEMQLDSSITEESTIFMQDESPSVKSNDDNFDNILDDLGGILDSDQSRSSSNIETHEQLLENSRKRLRSIIEPEPVSQKSIEPTLKIIDQNHLTNLIKTACNVFNITTINSSSTQQQTGHTSSMTPNLGSSTSQLQPTHYNQSMALPSTSTVSADILSQSSSLAALTSQATQSPSLQETLLKLCETIVSKKMSEMLPKPETQENLSPPKELKQNKTFESKLARLKSELAASKGSTDSEILELRLQKLKKLEETYWRDRQELQTSSTDLDDVSNSPRGSFKPPNKRSKSRTKSPTRLPKSSPISFARGSPVKLKSPQSSRLSESPLQIQPRPRSPYKRSRSRDIIKQSRSPIRILSGKRPLGPISSRSRPGERIAVKTRTRSRSSERYNPRVKLRSRSPSSRYQDTRIRPKSKSPSPFMRRLQKSRTRSPLRNRSRSPLRKRSRSPLRKRSRSPLRKRSRSRERFRLRSPHSARRSYPRRPSPDRNRPRSPRRLPLRRSPRRSPLRRSPRHSPFRLSPSPHLRNKYPLRRSPLRPQRQKSRSPLPLRRRSKSPFRFKPFRINSRDAPKSLDPSPFEKVSSPNILNPSEDLEQVSLSSGRVSLSSEGISLSTSDLSPEPASPESIIRQNVTSPQEDMRLKLNRRRNSPVPPSPLQMRIPLSPSKMRIVNINRLTLPGSGDKDKIYVSDMDISEDDEKQEVIHIQIQNDSFHKDQTKHKKKNKKEKIMEVTSTTKSPDAKMSGLEDVSPEHNGISKRESQVGEFSLHCPVCSICVNGTAEFERHLQSEEHRRKEFEWTRSFDIKNKKVEAGPSATVNSEGQWSCSICDIKLISSLDCYNRHIQSKKHHRKLLASLDHTKTLTSSKLNSQTTKNTEEASSTSTNKIQSVVQPKNNDMLDIPTVITPTSPLISEEEVLKKLKIYQHLDERLSAIIQDVEARPNKKLQNYIMKNGLLYEYIKLARGHRVLVPDAAKTLIMHNYHRRKGDSQHSCVTVTYHKIKRLFTWIGLYDDIVDYIRTCEICIRYQQQQGGSFYYENFHQNYTEPESYEEDNYGYGEFEEGFVMNHYGTHDTY